MISISVDELIRNRHRPREYDTEDGPWDPISGGATALLGTIGSLMMGVADFPIEIVRAVHSVKPTDSPRESGSKTPISSPKLLATRMSSTVRSMSNSSVPSEIPPLGGSITPTGALEHQLSNQSSSDASAISGQSSDRAGSRRTAPQLPNASGLSQEPTLSPTDTLDRQVSYDTALGAGKSVGKIVGAGLKSPMDFTLGLARGFHNAPKLYGDESVRQADKVTDFQSGLKAAGKVFICPYYPKGIRN